MMQNRKKRVQVKHACISCKKGHTGCNSYRPCNRCSRKEIDCNSGLQLKKRVQIKNACISCKKAHTVCNSYRPCNRCVKKEFNCKKTIRKTTLFPPIVIHEIVIPPIVIYNLDDIQSVCELSDLIRDFLS